MQKFFYITILLLTVKSISIGQSLLGDVHRFIKKQFPIELKGVNFDIRPENSAKNQRKIDSLQLIFNDPDFSAKRRLEAQQKIISLIIYKDFKKSYPDLKKYLDLSLLNADSFPVHLAQAYSKMGLYFQKLENYDSANYFFQQELELAKSRKLKNYILFARNDLAFLEEKKGNYTEALKEYLDISAAAAKVKNYNAEARARLNAGMILTLKSEYLSAMEQLLTAKNICEDRKLSGYYPSLYMALGDLYTAIDELNTASSYYFKSLIVSDNANNSNIKRLGLIQYIRLKKKYEHFTEAIQLSNKLLNFEDKISIPGLKAESLTLMAEIFHSQHNTDSALYYINEALKFYLESDIEEKLYQTYSLAGQIYYKKGDLPSAKKYCLLAEKTIKEKGDSEYLKNNSLCLYLIYKKENNIAKALSYHEEYLSSSNKVYDREKAKEIVKVQLQERYKNKTIQDSLQNQFKIAEIESVHQLKTAKKNRLLITLGIGLSALLIIALGLWVAFRINKKQKEELARLNQLNKQIFSIISHDFRGPLMSLNLMVETLKNTDPKELELSFFLEDIKSQITQTGNILDTLLNWAKSELQINLNDKYQTDLLRIGTEMKQIYEVHLQDKELILNIDIPNETLLNIHPDLLRIVLRNLLSNAIKFSYYGDSIGLIYDQKNSNIVIRDEGSGMTEEQKKNLFKKPVFSALGTKQESGFGIGLYITSELLKRIGWKISFTSEAENGSTFTIHH